MSWSDWLLPAAMQLVRWTHRRELIAAAANAEASQLGLLRRILHENAHTGFGKQHGFSEITDWESFRKRVPVQTYDSLAPYIQEQIASGVPALTAAPFLSLARTSGTSGPTKDIPMTAAGIESIRDAQRQLGLTLYSGSGFFDGAVLALYSPQNEGRLANGLVYGAASGHANSGTNRLLRAKFAYPPTLATVKDYDLKYYLYVLFGLIQPDVSGIATANPSSLCRLAELASEQRARLADDLERGTISQPGSLPVGLEADFAKRLQSRPAHARAMLQLLRSASPLSLSALWPNLKAIAVWTGGSCGVALSKLKPQLPANTAIVEIGYRASEFIGTVNVDAARNVCLPALTHTVFEFAEQDAWEEGVQRFTPISELVPGQRYYVLATTASGLYRYDINDIVEVTGQYRGCPTLAFLQKGKGVTSITGEKLYAHQAMSAIERTRTEVDGALTFCLLLADEESARYDVAIEAENMAPPLAARFVERLDACLADANAEYRDKRQSGRLKPPRPLLLKPGAGEAVKRQALARGQREAQYKTPCLDYAARFNFDFAPWLEPPA